MRGTQSEKQHERPTAMRIQTLKPDEPGTRSLLKCGQVSECMPKEEKKKKEKIQIQQL
jgi:hypothetical protein